MSVCTVSVKVAAAAATAYAAARGRASPIGQAAVGGAGAGIGELADTICNTDISLPPRNPGPGELGDGSRTGHVQHPKLIFPDTGSDDPSPDNPGAPSAGVSGGAGNFGGAMGDPLVLDLNGDGVRLTALQGSRAFFDLHGDGFARQTGWASAEDGILALDRNGDGQINDIGELFGNTTTDGFAALRTLDSDGNGRIDSGDAQFANLKVWRDANGNGISDAGELASLAETGVASIDLAARSSSESRLLAGPGGIDRISCKSPICYDFANRSPYRAGRSASTLSSRLECW